MQREFLVMSRNGYAIAVFMTKLEALCFIMRQGLRTSTYVEMI